MRDPRGRGAAGRTVIATTHDLACAAQHFHQAAFINGRIVAFGPAELVIDPALLAATYGGHVIVLPAGDRTMIDDAHHHDNGPPASGTSMTGRADDVDSSSTR